MRTAVIGIGSPNGDDRAGWLTLEALEAALATHERAGLGLVTIALDRPGAGLLEHLRDVDRAVLIDALVSDAAPGTCLRVPHAALWRGALSASSHGFGLADALTLGAQLRCLPPDLEVIGIVGASFVPQAPVSAPVKSAARALARSLATWLRRGQRASGLLAPPWPADLWP